MNVSQHLLKSYQNLKHFICHHGLGSYCLLCLGKPQINIAICEDCEADLPWAITHQNHVVPLFNYQFPVAQMIMRFKHSHDLLMGKLLAQLLAKHLPEKLHALDAQKDWLIVPIPLHRKRLAERGFNQALILAKQLVSTLPNSTLLPELIRRTKFCHSQQGLTPKARARNVANSFVVHQPMQIQQLLSGKPSNWLLVDDVFTSGATVADVSRCLQQAGIEKQKIYVACVAKVG